MKKRLRKKLHIGEFQELGFSISFNFKDTATTEEAEAFIGEFLTEVVEHQDLCFAGSGNCTEWEGLIMLNAMGSVTEEQRQTVTSWLEKADKVDNFEASELIDVWYE